MSLIHEPWKQADRRDHAGIRELADALMPASLTIHANGSKAVMHLLAYCSVGADYCRESMFRDFVMMVLIQ